MENRLTQRHKNHIYTDLELELNELALRRKEVEQRTAQKLDLFRKFEEKRKEGLGRLSRKLDEQNKLAQERNKKLLEDVTVAYNKSSSKCFYPSVIGKSSAGSEKLQQAKKRYTHLLEQITPALHAGKLIRLEERMIEMKNEEIQAIRRAEIIRQERLQEEQLAYTLEKQRQQLLHSLAIEHHEKLEAEAAYIMQIELRNSIQNAFNTRIALDTEQVSQKLSQQVQAMLGEGKALNFPHFPNPINPPLKHNTDTVGVQQREKQDEGMNNSSSRVVYDYSSMASKIQGHNSLFNSSNSSPLHTNKPSSNLQSNPLLPSNPDNVAGNSNNFPATTNINTLNLPTVVIDNDYNHFSRSSSRSPVANKSPMSNKSPYTSQIVINDEYNVPGISPKNANIINKTVNNNNNNNNNPVANTAGDVISTLTATDFNTKEIIEEDEFDIMEDHPLTSIKQLQRSPSQTSIIPSVANSNDNLQKINNKNTTNISVVINDEEDEFDVQDTPLYTTQGNNTNNNSKTAANANPANNTGTTIGNSRSSEPNYKSDSTTLLADISLPPITTEQQFHTLSQLLSLLFMQIQHHHTDSFPLLQRIYPYSSPEKDKREAKYFLFPIISQSGLALEVESRSIEQLGQLTVAILELMAPLLIPIEAFKGVMNKDKLKKEYKKSSFSSLNATFSSFCAHFSSLLESFPHSLEYLTKVLTNALIVHVEAGDRDRMYRKVSNLLQLAVLPSNEEGSSSPYRLGKASSKSPTSPSFSAPAPEPSLAPIPPSPTVPAPPAPASASLFKAPDSQKPRSGLSSVNYSAGLPTSRLHMDAGSSKVKEWEEDEIVEEEEIQKPPPLKALDGEREESGSPRKGNESSRGRSSPVRRAGGGGGGGFGMAGGDEFDF